MAHYKFHPDKADGDIAEGEFMKILDEGYKAVKIEQHDVKEYDITCEVGGIRYSFEVKNGSRGRQL